MKNLVSIIAGLVGDAEKLIGKTGAEKKAFVIEKVVDAGDMAFAPLNFVPDEYKEQFLNFLVDYTVSLVKHKA